MIDVDCFWCDPLPLAEVILRQYQTYHHDAQSVIGEVELSLEKYGDFVTSTYEIDGHTITFDDPRWPQKCDGCDYHFASSDNRIIYVNRVFRRVDTGEVFNKANPMPIGAMSWAPLAADSSCGGDTTLVTDGDGDGRSIFVVIPRYPDPNGFWHGSMKQTIRWEIDGLTAGSDRRRKTGEIDRTWKRTGTPPKITVEDGIQSYLGFTGYIREGRLHGFVNNRL